MPKWGLSERQRSAGPWGLPELLLRPTKVITDPVHADIYITELERRLIDSPPLQRLRRVRQLGNAHLVYPSATHTRFSHSIGALRVAQDLIDAVADNRDGPHHDRDLLDEWAESPNLAGGVRKIDICLAEAATLARLGALLHDICHVPLGHTIEDDLKVLTRHDQNLVRFRRMWDRLEGEARDAIGDAKSVVNPSGPSLLEELTQLILSSNDDLKVESSYPFVADIVGNTICADLIDYLQRDHMFTGLPFAVGDRFLDSFYVVDSHHLHYPKRMAVKISRSNRPRTDITTELVKYLQFRYELTERVLTHHTKVAADAMVGKLLEMWSEVVWLDLVQERYPEQYKVAGPEDLDAIQQSIAEAFPEEVSDVSGISPSGRASQYVGNKALAELDTLVKAQLEDHFLRLSDDGLLEHLAILATSGPPSRRTKAVSHLASAVLHRKLFKLIGHAESQADLALAEEKYVKFGSPEARRELERAAANEASLQHGYEVVVWLPSPDMKLKVAGVLVDNGNGIAPLDRLSDAGRRIVSQHKDLWSVGIYADLDVQTLDGVERAEEVLGSIKDQTDLHIVQWDGKVARSLEELLFDRIANRARLTEADIAALRTLAVPALEGPNNFRARMNMLWEAGIQAGIIEEESGFNDGGI